MKTIKEWASEYDIEIDEWVDEHAPGIYTKKISKEEFIFGLKKSIIIVTQ